MAPGPGSFLSVVRSGERPRWQHPPGPRGAGADGHPGTPDRRPLGAWPNCRPCAECSPPKSSAAYLGLQWARPLLWCRAPVTAFRPCPGAAPPGSGRFSRRDAEVRAALCWRRLRRPSRYRPPGFWAVLQENGLEFDALPGFWAVISVPRRDSRRCLRYNPRSEAFTSSAPRSAAYETAQNFARALANAQVPLHAAGLRNRPELCLAFQATNQSVGQAVRETAQNLARALCRTSDRAKNGVMDLRNRPELCSCVRPPSAG